ncbi:retrovirus-related Pol polyprotein from transposon 412 [Nephila pilipes]|uniref:Retrovirus-related Pol polyprotein from transposon 412 n=1 Tax=Nephila pilipes TaxID=299642 RepID=A0A8X6N832_NEPPI|nr:retrovirus-related Pol polyprotein from transposon 412 [Nephila pilipes]
MQQIRPKPTVSHAKQAVFEHKDFKTCTHVFVRRYSTRRPLQALYDGPFLVLKRSDKFLKVNVNGKPSTISTDRVKPAFRSNTESDIIPSTTKLSLDTPAKTNLYQTCSGRPVYFPDYFVSSR